MNSVMPESFDLARTSVFIDFDGTISVADTGEYLLSRLAPPQWRRFDDLYDAGTIGSRECIVAQFALLPRDEPLLRATAAQIPLDAGYEELLAMLRAAGSEVTIVSDGFGFHIADRCPGVTIVTNHGDPSTGTLTFPHQDPGCTGCGKCGTCKKVPIDEARARGRITVAVGDGTSDRYAAERADLVFAKQSLARWCDEHAIEYEPYTTLADVAASLRARARV